MNRVDSPEPLHHSGHSCLDGWAFRYVGMQGHAGVCKFGGSSSRTIEISVKNGDSRALASIGESTLTADTLPPPVNTITAPDKSPPMRNAPFPVVVGRLCESLHRPPDVLLRYFSLALGN
jgi:hypothetical protein